MGKLDQLKAQFNNVRFEGAKVTVTILKSIKMN